LAGFGGHPNDIHMIFSICGNLLNQLPNVNRAVEAFSKVDFILVGEQFLTPTARFADILLPAAHSLEREDVFHTWVSFGHYAMYMNKAVEPLGECRTDLDWCADLAQRLGIEGFNPKTDTEWTAEFVANSAIPDDLETFKRNGVSYLPRLEHPVAFWDQVHDPDNHRFNTPTGKIELYSTRIAERPDYYGLGAMDPVPTWRPAPETWLDHGQRARYPLQMITPKSRARTHSTHANQERLQRVEPQRCQMHPDDAAPRGIGPGATVRVYNDRGATVLPVWLSDQIMPGTVAVADGAWYAPRDGLDRGGNPNLLTRDEPSAGGSPAYNHALVEVAVFSQT
jgi:anaerobic dimethyl sulfoxide reductase subunit A